MRRINLFEFLQKKYLKITKKEIIIIHVKTKIEKRLIYYLICSGVVNI